VEKKERERERGEEGKNMIMKSSQKLGHCIIKLKQNSKLIKIIDLSYEKINKQKTTPHKKSQCDEMNDKNSSIFLQIKAFGFSS
jgi:hypothetical protein